MYKIDALVILLLVFTDVSSFAQRNVVCVKQREHLAFSTDTSDLIYTRISVIIDSNETSYVNIPKKYYEKADSIIIKLRKILLPYDEEKIQISYCYNVGPHCLALYLSPSDFPLECSVDDTFYYQVDLYFKSDNWYVPPDLQNDSPVVPDLQSGTPR